jgi:hypothetical protein
MSEAGGSSADSVESADDLVAALHAALGHNNRYVSVSHHGSAVRKLARLRTVLAGGGSLTQRSQILLLCTGVALQKRVALMEDGETAAATYGTTLVLVFVVIAMTGRPGDAIAAEGLVERAGGATLWQALTTPGAMPSPGEVAAATLTLAVAEIDTQDEDGIRVLADRFFRASAAAMVESKLKELGEGCFLSLSSSRFVGAASDRSDRLETLVSAAESEAGQSVIRDIMLSFLLPARVVGTRRALLLSRQAATEATVEYPEDVQRAHETAMAGAMYVWNEENEGPDWELRKVSVLLACVACATTRGGEDPIRKAAAFGGRVQLPFLDTPACTIGKRLALVPGAVWILYSLNRKGAATILTSAEGLEGLKLACLGLMDQE